MAEIEIEFICSSCQVDFVYKCFDPDTEKWAEIQDLLKEKEPKCEKCVCGAWSWGQVIESESVPPGMMYCVDPKYLFDEWNEIQDILENSKPGKIEWRPKGDERKVCCEDATRITWRLAQGRVFQIFYSNLITRSEKILFIEFLQGILDSGEKNED